jgi:hypothetical protein
VVAAFIYFLAAAISAFLLNRIVLQQATWVVRLLSAMVIATALVLLPVQVLAAFELAGWIGPIRIWALTGVQLGVLAAIALWTLRRAPAKNQVDEALTRGSFPPGKLPAVTWISGAVLAGSYLIFTANLVSSYPSGWDALTYHLPVALHWLQNGSLRIASLSAWQYGLPGNAEIGMMLLMSTGREALAPAVNVFAIVLLGVAVYGVAFQLARGKKSAVAAVTLIALSMPIVEFQSFSGYVDLFGTAFLSAAVALFLARKEMLRAGTKGSPSTILLFLSAIACGVSIGTKPVFYVYAAVYCWVVAVMLMRESGINSRAFWRGIGVVAAGVLLTSVFWFGRGFAATGNPLFPMQVKLGKHVLFRGFAPSQITSDDFADKFVRERAEWIIYPWTEYLRVPGEQSIAYSEGSGTGAAFATFVPLGLLFALYRFATHKGGRTETILLVTLVGLVVVWWISLQRMPRFGLPLLVLACVLATPLLVILTEFAGRGFGVLLLAGVMATSAISTFVPLRDLGGHVRSHDWSRAHAYGYPKLVDDLPPGTTLLNDTGISEANFELAGNNLSNRVIADFEVPNPITPEFLAGRHVDFVVEAAQPGGGKVGFRQTAKFSPPSLTSVTATAGGKNWVFWPVGQRQEATSNTSK